MKEPEKGGFGETPEDMHGYPGTLPSSPTAKVSDTNRTPYSNLKPKPQAKIPQNPSDSTPMLPPFISGSTESRSSNSPHDRMTQSQAGALRKQNKWYTEFFLLISSKIKMHLEWVPANLTYPKLKPAIQSAVAAWVCMVLFVIPAFERAMGQASFVILIGEFNRNFFIRFWARYLHYEIAFGGLILFYFSAHFTGCLVPFSNFKSLHSLPFPLY